MKSVGYKMFNIKLKRYLSVLFIEPVRNAYNNSMFQILQKCDWSIIGVSKEKRTKYIIVEVWMVLASTFAIGTIVDFAEFRLHHFLSCKIII